MGIRYNAPFVLTFTFFCAIIMGASEMTAGHTTQRFFTLHPIFVYQDPLSYLRLISHAAGHASWEHLSSNLAYILLIGPILEEKYGTKNLFVMSLITALITGLLNIFLYPSFLLGASGIVFMMILLGSFTNVKDGGIPLTFILVLVVFLGQEIVSAFEENNISEFAHVVGGICGSIFGFAQNTKLT